MVSPQSEGSLIGTPSPVKKVRQPKSERTKQLESMADIVDQYKTLTSANDRRWVQSEIASFEDELMAANVPASPGQ